MATAYRPCVLAVFTNAAGDVLVCERSDVPGQWQFPQGGQDPDETPELAVRREVREELGTDAFDVVRRGAGLVRYDFPPELDGKIARKWRGQEQTWFLLRFRDGAGPDLAQAEDKEFVATRWVTPRAALDGIVAFKRQAYADGLRALGLLQSGE